MQPQKWSDDFIRHMLAKGSLHPPREGYSRFELLKFNPLVWIGIGLGIVAAFLYGAFTG